MKLLFSKYVRLGGINECAFNGEHLQFKKSVLLQKSKDEQVISHIKQRQAFSKDIIIQVALGARLMGSKATIRAHAAQIKNEKASAVETATKEGKQSLCEGGEGSNILPTLQGRRQDVVGNLAGFHEIPKKTTSSKITSIVKVKEKLNSFEAKFGSSWDKMMEISQI